jgi:methionyl aminopeptidase
MIIRKSQKELRKMADAGSIAAETLAAVRDAAKPGVSTRDLDRIAERLIRAAGGAPTFKGYRGFPASICASPNSMIVHGIPNDEPLTDGDELTVDLGVTYRGYVADSAVTFPIGTVPERTLELLRACQASLAAAIDACQEGARLSDIGHAVQTCVEGRGFGVVRELVGHGVGRSMHEDPQVRNYGDPGRGPELREGTVLAIEPMITDGSYDIVVADDQWSIYTVDGSLASHFEHTVAVTADGPLVLTRADNASVVDAPI